MNQLTTKEALLQASDAPAPRSQATMIEQSRAVAEVQAAVVIAQHNPRDKTKAIREMKESCEIQSLAERAFFRFPRGGQTVSGKSVHLARELARCWGNIDYGAKELARNDGKGESEMLAFAWDLETNARAETSFIVPHKRDKKGGPQALVDMRDIYENNANNAARRLREQIFSVLPIWFVEHAEQICQQTLIEGGGVPLPQRIARMTELFESIGVTREMVEKRQSKELDKLTAHEVALLGVVYKSITRGEVTIADEFSEDEAGTTTKALKEQAAKAKGKPKPQKKDAPKSGESDPAPAPPPDEDEPPEGEEIIVPTVKVALDSDGNPKWRWFAAAVKEAMEKAPTLVHLTAFIHQHEAALKNLKEAEPEFAAELETLAETRMQALGPKK